MAPLFAYTPDIWPPLLAVAFCALLAAYVFPRRFVPGGVGFLAGLIAIAAADVVEALLMSAISLDLKIFFRGVWLAALLMAVLSLVAQTFDYAGLMQRVPKPVLVANGLITSALAALGLTNPAHRLVWRAIWPDEPNHSMGLHSAFGPAGILAVGYAYFLVLTGLAVIAAVATRGRGRLRHQATLVGMGMLVITGAYSVDAARNNQWLQPALSTAIVPSAVTLLGLALLAFALIKFQAFDLTPVARHSVVEHMQDGMLVLDAKGRVVDTNPGAVRLLGIDRSRAIGKDMRTVLAAWPEVLDAIGSAVDGQAHVCVERGLGKRSVDIEISPLTNSSGAVAAHHGLLLMCRDVTEIRRAEATVQKQRLALATLTERERLGRELHDGLAQVLAYAKVQVAATSDGLARCSAEQSRAELETIEAVLQEAHEEVRDFLLGIKQDRVPREDVQTDLHAAVAGLASRFSARHGFQVEILGLREGSAWTLSPETQVQLIRILQESLVNVQRHAGVPGAAISFETRGSLLRVRVRDEGSGFDPSGLVFTRPGAPADGRGPLHAQEAHYGLAFMRERAEAVGGRLEIVSQAGQGTEVCISVPLAPEPVAGRVGDSACVA